MRIKKDMSFDEAVEILSDNCCTDPQEVGTTDITFYRQTYKVEDALELARFALHEMGEARKLKRRIYDL